MFQSNLSRCFITLVLVLGFQCQGLANEKNNQAITVPPEIEQLDTQRLYKGLLDLGIYQTYRLSPKDLGVLTSDQAQEIIKVYINNYYAQYMYFSRNLIMTPTTDVYTADIIQKIQTDFEKKHGATAKKLLTRFHREQGGVSYINSLLYQIVTEAVVNHEIQKFGKTLPQQLPAFHSPNSLYLAYLKKLKLRPYEYNPPFNPEMDLQQPAQKFTEVVTAAPAIFSNAEDAKVVSGSKHWYFGLGGIVIGFMLAMAISFFRKNAKT